MNLLPWRIEQFKQKSRVIFVKTSVMALLIGVISLMLMVANQHFAQAIAQQQERLQQQQSQRSELTRQVAQLRRQITPNVKQVPVPHEQVMNMINMLIELPLTQGELQQTVLQQGYISLKGTASNQSEFEPLQPFLTQYFPDIKLSQFEPLHDNQLQFKFEQGEME
ncbi:hypothetical protein [Actinobacillus porcinus]|uniref:hypothetical protein n=1 Tax=Actinobacillus porcinus TaxID=51048 RepID=UPI0023531C89|nr:hypothetical protein [Actinobacillus porcinus]